MNPLLLKMAFVKSPKDFLASHSTQPKLPTLNFRYKDLNGLIVTVNDKHGAMPAHSEAYRTNCLEYTDSAETVNQMERHSLFCQLRMATKNESAHAKCFMECTIAKSDSCLQIYYLDYMKNAITFMKLSQNHAIKHFTTAQFTGCSFYVAGDPKAPTVYHANSDGVGNKETDPVKRDRKKLDYMNGLFTMASSHRKEALLYQLAPSSYDQAFQDVKTEKFGNDKRKIGDTGEFVQEQTTLVGEKRSDGTWHFYFQLNITADYERHTKLSKLHLKKSEFHGIKFYSFDVPARQTVL